MSGFIKERKLATLNGFEIRRLFLIGDSLTSDIQGGINFAIDTCWYNSNKTPSMKGINPTYTITKLEELYKIL